MSSSNVSLNSNTIEKNSNETNQDNNSQEDGNGVLDSKLKEFLSQGSRMLKYPKKSSKKPDERLVKIEWIPLQIVYISSGGINKKNGIKTVDLHSIKEIRCGQSTKGFELQGKSPEIEEKAFSVIYIVQGEYKNLDLVTQTSDERMRWVKGLKELSKSIQENEQGGLIDSPRDPHHQQNSTDILRKLWDDINNSKKNSSEMDLEGITVLLKKLNIKLSKSEVKSALKNMAFSTRSLTFHSFEKYYNSLKERSEMIHLFNNVSENHPEGISYEQFKKFVLEIQKVPWDEEQCIDYYQKYSPTDGARMNRVHFSAFLMSANNSIVLKKYSNINQDMTLPLNNYFVCSSHNTYLLGDQLRGESSIEGYIRALQRGCKCVELDCWDGPNGQPIIYHGMTLTTKVLFRDVIEAIAKYAFVVSSYPVILSLETHCCLEQQEAMATILKEVLGDTLVKSIIDHKTEFSPSPQSLMNKIIVKGKTIDDQTENFEEEEELTLDSSQQSSFADRLVQDPIVEDERKPIQEESKRSLSRKSSSTSAKVKKPKAIHKALSELAVYCKAKTFPGFLEAKETFHSHHMSSLSEKKGTTLLQKQSQDFIDHTSRFLIRIYPVGTRVNSSNYDPLPFWQVGAQLVALNFQTFDKGMQLNDALFRYNGSCGYVLKPSRLRIVDPTKSEPSAPAEFGCILTIQIISGTQLPRRSGSSDVSDPYVEVEIIGVGQDCNKFRTRTVHDNGLKPHWDETFQFSISDPDFAILRLQVFDEDSLSNDFVACYTAPLVALAQGYRHAPLYNYKGELERFSTLFLYISKKEIVKEIKGRNREHSYSSFEIN